MKIEAFLFKKLASHTNEKICGVQKFKHSLVILRILRNFFFHQRNLEYDQKKKEMTPTEKNSNTT